MQRFKAVLFDLDDTLYPAMQFRLSGSSAVADYMRKVFGMDIRDEMMKIGNNQTGPDPCATLIERHTQHPDPLLLRRLQAVYNYHQPQLTLFSDAQLALALLQAQGMPCGLVTDYYGQVQRNKVRALQLNLLMDAFLYADDLGGMEFWKPSQEPFHVMAAQMDCDPAEFVFVGDDAALDFIAPRQLGMGTIRVARGRPPVEAAPAQPDRDAHISIASLDMIWDAIQMLEKSMQARPLAAGCN